LVSSSGDDFKVLYTKRLNASVIHNHKRDSDVVFLRVHNKYALRDFFNLCLYTANQMSNNHWMT